MRLSCRGIGCATREVTGLATHAPTLELRIRCEESAGHRGRRARGAHLGRVCAPVRIRSTLSVLVQLVLFWRVIGHEQREELPSARPTTSSNPFT